MRTNTRTLHVEWGDCDPTGIVYFPRYFEWFDACTAALFESVGFPKQVLLRTFDIVGMPMVEARAKFIIPSQFDDEAVVETYVSQFRRSSFDVHHRLLKEGQLAVEGFETRVWTGRDPENPSKFKSRPIPDEVKVRLG